MREMNHRRSKAFFPPCLHNLAVRKSQVLVVGESKSLEGPIFLFFHLSALAFVPGSCRVLGLRQSFLLLCISLKSPFQPGFGYIPYACFFFVTITFFFPFWLSFTRLSRTHRLLSACCWYCEASGGRRSTTPQEQWIFPIIWLSQPPALLPPSPLPLPCSPPPSLYYPAVSPALFRGNLRVLGVGGALL